MKIIGRGGWLVLLLIAVILLLLLNIVHVWVEEHP